MSLVDRQGVLHDMMIGVLYHPNIGVTTIMLAPAESSKKRIHAETGNAEFLTRTD